MSEQFAYILIERVDVDFESVQCAVGMTVGDLKRHAPVVLTDRWKTAGVYYALGPWKRKHCPDEFRAEVTDAAGEVVAYFDIERIVLAPGTDA